MNICIEDNCTTKPHARGLCKSHYAKHRRSGTLDRFASSQSQKLRHLLSNIDTTLETATCQLCGPVSVKFRGHRPAGSIRWECLEAIRAKNRSRKWTKYRYDTDKHLDTDVVAIEYEKLLAQQDGVCAICRNPPNPTGRALALDHCHSSGRIRGLLCGTCNRGLGFLKDDPKLLLAALDYLDDN